MSCEIKNFERPLLFPLINNGDRIAWNPEDGKEKKEKEVPIIKQSILLNLIIIDSSFTDNNNLSEFPVYSQ